MEFVVGNTYTTLKTNNPSLIAILRKKYRAKVPGAEYSKSYRKGWDGYKYFISNSGKFGTGLLPFIQGDLESVDISYSVIDTREPAIEDYSIELENISFREYQYSLINLALEKRQAIIQAPTGSGKTVILAGILKALQDKRGVIFFTQKTLLLQTYDFLKGLGFDVGIAFGGGEDIKPITLCTVQSVHKILDSHLQTSEFIIFDEVHEFSKGKLTTKVVSSFPNASYRFGLTATIPKEKIAKLNLISFLGGVISEVDVLDLVNSGFLTPPIVSFIKVPECRDDVYNKTYFDIYEEYIINNDWRNNKIADICNSINKGKILILVKNLKHLEILKKILPNSITLEGKDNAVSRKNKIETFKTSDSAILIGTKIMQTGVDIPEITHLINARGLKSEIATIQALGRTLRIHDSKSEVFIYDFLDSAPYLDAHSRARKRAYKSLGIKIND